MVRLFFELIQVAIGNKDKIGKSLSNDELQGLFQLSCKHSIASILLDGFEKLQKDIDKPQQVLLLEWIGIQLQTVTANQLQNKRAQELCELLTTAGYRNCILKGQGTALYYDKPEIRQCGDIDVWVEGDRDEIIDFARGRGYEIPHIDIKHSDVVFFEDVPVEVHFMPSWMYNPCTNKKLQAVFTRLSDKQFENYDTVSGFTHTTIDFDLVYSIVHIYRHIFSEGIGLRQLIDYYYILKRSTPEQRKEAAEVLVSLKMTSFVGGVMWILCDCLGMKKEFALCPNNEGHGRFLLSEILTAGNFGKYDSRVKRIDVEKRLERGFVQLKRNFRFVMYYPSEVLWSPFWKLWHWAWRKRKGYL